MKTSHGTFEDMCAVYLSLEYSDRGDLNDKILERGLQIEEAEVVDWMRQVCNAMAALHKAGVCHRDVKPENFMLQAARTCNAGASGLCLKLSDFGLARFLHREGRCLTRCGTPSFMAPEVHAISSSIGYGFPVDMWSVGVSMYVMMFGGLGPFIRASGEIDFKALFAGAVNFREKIDLLGLKVGCGRLRFSERARNFCERLLQCNPSQRPTAAEAFTDPWLHGPTKSQKLGPIKVLQPGPRKESNLDMPSRWGTVLSEMENGTEPGIEIATEAMTVMPVNYRICKSGASVPNKRRAKKSTLSGDIFQKSGWARSVAEAPDAVVLTKRWNTRHAGNPVMPSTVWHIADTIQGESLHRKIHAFI